MKYLIAFIIFGLTCFVLANSKAKVDENIWKNLEESDTTNILVTFRKSNTKDAYARFHALKLTGRSAKLNTQYAILKDHADIVQADVTALLNKAASDGKKHKIAQLWISNELIVRNINKKTVELLRNHPDVESLQAEWFINLEDNVEEEVTPQSNNTIQNQWGVINIGAQFVWSDGNTGQGVAVGIIDSGVRATHINLRNSYRGNDLGQNHNYNWFDPNGSVVPIDSYGQGTHVTGIASGTDGIGVAPGSRWIHCRGCPSAACSNLDLTQCANWMACPTNTIGGAPDCTRAPRVINNSWGGPGNNPWFDSAIIAWVNVGIVPIFAAGNSGPGCSSLLSPGDRPGSISVGSIMANNQRSPFSSNGPTADGRPNPFIAAPGTSVPSASHLADDALRTLSSTFMSAPHITGVVALLGSRNPNLTIAQVTNALSAGALLHTPVGATCGGVTDFEIPNNHVGRGRIYAPNALISVSEQ